ncbi:2OG-Fe(II) oxygenase [Gracilaria domingensis]|nr:2OG-Fe(II) oxygenase [Gracilaria domingensis]
MQTYAKHSVIQAEVPHLPSTISVPYLRALNDEPSLAAYLNVYWPKLTIRDQAVKVQRATGRRGCFPIHIDSSPEADRRVVTALLYPHEQWSHEGGALRIYNTPISKVDVLPVPGRLVLLSSTLMHHRVRSTEHHRFAITLWLSGTLQSIPHRHPRRAA